MSSCATWQSTCATEDTNMIGIENGFEDKIIIYVLYQCLEGKKIYVSYNGLERCFCMYLEHVFLYWWWHSNLSSSLIGWQNISLTQEWVYWFVMIDLCMKLIWEVHFPNSRGMSNHLHQYVINYFNLSVQLPSYCLPFALLLSMSIYSQIHHFQLL